MVSLEATLSVKVKTSGNVTAAVVEYFLYSIIILETCIAAFAYKTISQVAHLSLSTRGYLILLYFGVLAWVFFQLNRLHRKRRQAAAVVSAQALGTEITPMATGPAGIALTPSPAATGTCSELPLPVSPAAAIADSSVTAPASTGPFGLSWIQLAFVFVVFLAALKVFSWVLTNLVKR